MGTDNKTQQNENSSDIDMINESLLVFNNESDRLSLVNFLNQPELTEQMLYLLKQEKTATNTSAPIIKRTGVSVSATICDSKNKIMCAKRLESDGRSTPIEKRIFYLWYKKNKAWSPIGLISSNETGQLLFLQDELQRLQRDNFIPKFLRTLFGNGGLYEVSKDATENPNHIESQYLKEHYQIEKKMADQLQWNLVCSESLTQVNEYVKQHKSDVFTKIKPYQFIRGKTYYITHLPLEIICDPKLMRNPQYSNAALAALSESFVLPDPSWDTQTLKNGIEFTVNDTDNIDDVHVPTHLLEWLAQLYNSVKSLDVLVKKYTKLASYHTSAKQAFKSIASIIDAVQEYPLDDSIFVDAPRANNFNAGYDLAKNYCYHAIEVLDKEYIADEAFSPQANSHFLPEVAKNFKAKANKLVDKINTILHSQEFLDRHEQFDVLTPEMHPFADMLNEDAIPVILTESYVAIATGFNDSLKDQIFKEEVVPFLIDTAKVAQANTDKFLKLFLTKDFAQTLYPQLKDDELATIAEEWAATINQTLTIEQFNTTFDGVTDFKPLTDANNKLLKKFAKDHVKKIEKYASCFVNYFSDSFVSYMSNIKNRGLVAHAGVFYVRWSLTSVSSVYDKAPEYYKFAKDKFGSREKALGKGQWERYLTKNDKTFKIHISNFFVAMSTLGAVYGIYYAYEKYDDKNNFKNTINLFQAISSGFEVPIKLKDIASTQLGKTIGILTSGVKDILSPWDVYKYGTEAVISFYEHEYEPAILSSLRTINSAYSLSLVILESRIKTLAAKTITKSVSTGIGWVLLSADLIYLFYELDRMLTAHLVKPLGAIQFLNANFLSPKFKDKKETVEFCGNEYQLGGYLKDKKFDYSYYSAITDGNETCSYIDFKGFIEGVLIPRLKGFSANLEFFNIKKDGGFELLVKKELPRELIAKLFKMSVEEAAEEIAFVKTKDKKKLLDDAIAIKATNAQNGAVNDFLNLLHNSQ
jgi:hypothetical protein